MSYPFTNCKLNLNKSLKLVFLISRDNKQKVRFNFKLIQDKHGKTKVLEESKT